MAGERRSLEDVFGISSEEPFAAIVREVVQDPSTSNWLRLALQDAMVRDPVDAANDAETLGTILTMRAELALRNGTGLRRT